MKASVGEVSRLLKKWSDGDQAALDKLIPLVYDELHRMAKRYMGRQHPGRTMQTTALIHEAYLRLVGQPDKRWENRAHFFAVGAQAMRHVLIDYARSQLCVKRGEGVRPLSLDESAVVPNERAMELIALDEALRELTALHARQSKVVELRFFGGLTVQETADVLKLSPDTILRDWRMAKAWLYRALSRKETNDAGTVSAD